MIVIHCSITLEENINNPVSISRRLAPKIPESSNFHEGQTYHSPIDFLSKTAQSREVGIDSHSKFCFNRDEISHSIQHCQRSSRENPRHSRVSDLVSDSVNCFNQIFLSLLRRLNAAPQLVILGRLPLCPLLHVPINPSIATHTMFRDASGSGWWAHLEPEGLLFHGVWTTDQSRLHINVREMMAISIALRDPRDFLTNTIGDRQ